MIGALSGEEEDEELSSAALEAATRVFDRVEQSGLNLLFTELVNAVQDNVNGRRRATGARLFELFFDTTKLDLVPILPMALPTILPIALADSENEALAAGVRALNGIGKKCKKEELAPYLTEVRTTVLGLVSDPET